MLLQIYEHHIVSSRQTKIIFSYSLLSDSLFFTEIDFEEFKSTKGITFGIKNCDDDSYFTTGKIYDSEEDSWVRIEESFDEFHEHLNNTTHTTPTRIQYIKSEKIFFFK